MTAPIEDFDQAQHRLRQELAARFSDLDREWTPEDQAELEALIEDDLHDMWHGDEPPEQVDLDAMNAYRAVEWPNHPRRRAVIAFVGLAIGLASVAAIILALGNFLGADIPLR